MSARISIACERCRFSKRRCRPPFPCTNCLSAGVRCDVRGKARPQRRGKPLLSDTVISPSSSPRLSSSQPSCENTASFTTNLSIANTFSSEGISLNSDVFEVVRDLVAKRALDYYGYNTADYTITMLLLSTSIGHKFECNLPEPKKSKFGRIRRHDNSSAMEDIGSITSLNQEQVESFISALSSGPGQIQSVDIRHLVSISQTFFDQLRPKTCLGSTDLSTLDIPIDSLAFLFASLALGCVLKCHNFDAAHSLFNISTELLEEYTERSSLDLVSAYFMQHLFILRTGSSNRAKGIIVQAIQAAHDLGIHKGVPSSPGLQHIHLYLLLYFADQYLAMSHNTSPIIKSSDYSTELFDPLAQAEPHLRIFIELVRINGHIFEHIHGNQCTYDNTLRLESRIEQMCAAIWWPCPVLPSSDTPAPHHEALVRIHMFWSRIMLRAPFIKDSKRWISSISVCIRAAQMLSSIYLQIYKPAVITPDQPTEHTMHLQPQFLQIDDNLPLTWRQVKRITTSALIIVYAHWHGEASHEETSRVVATALLLLKCQRIRWRDEIDGVVKALHELANLVHLKIEPYLLDLLPGATTDVLMSIADEAAGRHHELQVQFRTPTANTSSSQHLFEPDIQDFESVSQVDDGIYGSASIDDFYGLLSDTQTMDNSTWIPSSSWSTFGEI